MEKFTVDNNYLPLIKTLTVNKIFIVLCTLGSTFFCSVYNKAKHPRSFFSSEYQLEKLAIQVSKTCELSGSTDKRKR